MKDGRAESQIKDAKDLKRMNDHPKWFGLIGEVTWKNRITPM